MKGFWVCVLCIWGGVIQAQIGWSLGPRASYELNAFKADSEDQFGFSAGVTLQSKVSRIFYFDTGLFWVQKRFVDFSVPCDLPNPEDCHENITGHYDYLQLPLLVRVNMSPFGNYRPYVSTGIGGGRLMTRKSEYVYPDRTRAPFRTDMNDWLFFFFLRAGLDFEISPSANFLLEAHGSYTTPTEWVDPGSNFVSVGVGVTLLFDLNGDPEQKLPDL